MHSISRFIENEVVLETSRSRSEILRKNLDVSTEELLSAEERYYVDLYTMSGNQNTLVVDTACSCRS
jgi:hypothetical protein